MQKTGRVSLVPTPAWTLLLASALAFSPHMPVAEPSSGNLVSNGDFAAGCRVPRG